MHEYDNEGGMQLGSGVDRETQNKSPADREAEEETELSTEKQVHEALHNISDLQVVMRPSDQQKEMVAKFCSAGCDCHKKCSSQFSPHHIRDTRAQLSLLLLSSTWSFIESW